MKNSTKIKQIEHKKYRDMLTFMFYTDTRIDEAMGMLRTDINSNKRDISISKT